MGLIYILKDFSAFYLKIQVRSLRSQGFFKTAALKKFLKNQGERRLPFIIKLQANIIN